MLLVFNELTQLIGRDDFINFYYKYSVLHFMKIHLPILDMLHTYGQTDITELIDGFFNFVDRASETKKIEHYIARTRSFTPIRRIFSSVL